MPGMKMGTARPPPVGGATENPLWQGGPTLHEVTPGLFEKFRLAPSTRKELALALEYDLRNLFHLPEGEEGRMLRLILLEVNDYKRAMGWICGHKATALALRDGPKNPPIEGLLPQIRTAHDLAVLKGVLRDGDRRWELVIDLACEELETLKESGTAVSHEKAVDAMRRGMRMAFPESTEDNKHMEKIDEVLQRALPPTKDGATGRRADASPITSALCDAFRKTVTRHLVVSHILDPFQELARDLIRIGRWPESQIVERVLDGLTDELRPVEADSLTRAQFNVLLERLGDSAIRGRIEGEVWVALAPDRPPPDRIAGEVTDAMQRTGGIQAALERLRAPPEEIELRLAGLLPETHLNEEADDLLSQFQDWLNQRFNELAPGLGQQHLDQSKAIERIVSSVTKGRSSKVGNLTGKEALEFVNLIRGWSGRPPIQRNELS